MTLNRCGPKSSKTFLKFWTAVMRGLLAKNETSESLSSDLVSVLALGDVDPLGRSGLSADATTRRMHTNLAHASVPDMRRMLMAARAPQPILDALARFSCAQCDAMTVPKIPWGVSVPQTVAMDVKWLPGWEEDVRVKSVNIVDEASNLQHIRSLRQRHRRFFHDSIVRRPRWLEDDASRTNLGETLQRALQADGTQLLDVPGEQVGRVEVHGRYFEYMLAQIRPSSRAAWLECTTDAKNSLTRRCGYSPFQVAVGRDPELPGDLLHNLPNVISSSSILHDDVAAHTARFRSNARLAVMHFNDNLATRRALDQRPRPLREFSVGDEVAVEARHWKRCPWQAAACTMAWSWHQLGSSRRQLFCGHARERHQSRSRTAEAQNGRRTGGGSSRASGPSADCRCLT